MTRVIIFITSVVFGILLVINFYLWKPVEIEAVKAPPTVTPIVKLDRKALVDNPPAQSQKGEITQIEGEVGWESRAANDFSVITQTQSVQQGEKLKTGEDGSVVISFNDNISVTMAAETEVHFVQTLQDKFVFNQPAGEVFYTNLNIAPLSVRAGAIIVQLTNGTMEINRDDENQTITVSITQGSAQIAYNNADFVSQIKHLEQGDVFLFDIEERNGEINYEL